MLTCTNLTYANENKCYYSGLGFSLLPSSLLCLSGGDAHIRLELLKQIAGINNDQHDGHISYAEADAKEDESFIEQSIFWQPDMLTDINNQTVIELITQWAERYDQSERIEATIHYWRLEAVLHKKYKRLSPGLKRHTELAYLMIKPALIWLLNEPEKDLKEEGKAQLFELIKTHIKHNGIVIVNSYNSGELNAVFELNIDDYSEAKPQPLRHRA